MIKWQKWKILNNWNCSSHSWAIELKDEKNNTLQCTPKNLFHYIKITNVLTETISLKLLTVYNIHIWIMFNIF